MPASLSPAVAAKAPRKNLPSSRSVLSPSRSGNKKKAKNNGGNPFKMWPMPKWQKGLHTFLGTEQQGGSSSAGGESSSSSSSANTSMTEAEMAVDEQLGAGSSSRCQDELEESSCTSGVATDLGILSGDIVQLNSDSESDD